MKPKNDLFAVQGTTIYLCLRGQLFAQTGTGGWVVIDEKKLPPGLVWNLLDSMTRSNWTDTLSANGLLN